MADTDIELSVDLDVKDAEATAKDLQKEIEKIFEARKGEQSASFASLELQMKKNYETAEALRLKMIELAKDVPTAEYAKVLDDMKAAQIRYNEITSQLSGKENLQEQLDYYNQIRSAIEQLEESGKDTIIDPTGILGPKGMSYDKEDLEAQKDYTQSVIDEVMALQDERRSLSSLLDELSLKKDALESSNSAIIIGTETEAYKQAETALDVVNDKLKQEIIHYNEIEQKEQASIDKAREKLALEQAMKAEMEERHRIQMDIAKKNWETAVAEEERQAALSQQRALALAEQKALEEEARRAQQEQQAARMETIAANSSLMAMNMAIRSIGRIIPGVSTAAISGVVMLTRAVLRLTKLTKAELVMAIGKVKAAFASLFAFIMAHPIVLVITALIAAIVILIKKLKELWDETAEQVDELFELAGAGLEKLKGLSADFVKTLTVGFIKIGDLLPSTLLKAVQGIINKLKSLKSTIKENLDLMAQWNDGNNEVNTALSNITSSLNYLKATLATSVAPILIQFEPILTRFIDILAEILNMVSMVIAKITGATTYQKAVRVQNDYAESLSNTAKAANDATAGLAGFDKLNVLSSGSDSGSKKTVDFSMFKLEDTALPDWMDDFSKLGSKLGKILKKFLKNIDWKNIQNKAGKLGTNIAEFINGFFDIPDLGKTIGATLGEGLNTITTLINNFLNDFDGAGFGSQIGDALQTMVTTIHWDEIGDMFSGSLNKIVEIVKNFALSFSGEDLGTAFTTFLQNALGGIKWDEIQIAIKEVVNDIAGFFNNAITPENFSLIGTTLGNLLNTILTGVDVFVNKAEWETWGDSVATGIMDFIKTADFKKAGQDVGNVVEGLLDMIGTAISKLTDPDNLEIIIQKIKDFFTNIPWRRIAEKAKEISKNLREGIEKIWVELKNSGAYDDIIKFIADFLQEKENWDKLFAGFKKDVVADLFWEKIKGVFVSVGESIVGAFKKLFNFLSEGLSNIVSFFDDFVFGDSSFNDWMSGKTPTQIHAPKLAQGAVLPPNKPFLAVVGDQKQGTNIEAPLSTIEKAVANVLGSMNVRVILDVEGDPNRIFKVVKNKARIEYNQSHEQPFVFAN